MSQYQYDRRSSNQKLTLPSDISFSIKKRSSILLHKKKKNNSNLMSVFGTIFIYFIIFAIIFILLLVFPQSKRKDEKKEEVKTEPKKETAEEFQDRSVSLDLEEFPEEQLPENATEEVKKKHEWNHNVRKITKTISKITNGNLKAINFRYVDRLINVRGTKNPIAFFLRPRSSELAPTGVFIYDTTRIAKDNALYLFAGPEATDHLIELGEKLLGLMIDDTECPNVIRIIKTMEGPDFNRMIYQMGGHKDMIQSGQNYGDQLFFEIQFFKTLLHIMIFEGELMTEQTKPDFKSFPDNGAAVIDTSDNALYLYVGHVKPESEEEKETQNRAISWMNDQPEFKGRELLVFDKSKIPPNLALIFGE